MALLVSHYLSNTASSVFCTAYSVKDHHKLPNYSPLLRKTCVRQEVLDKWFPLVQTAPRGRPACRRRARLAGNNIVITTILVCTIVIIIISSSSSISSMIIYIYIYTHTYRHTQYYLISLFASSLPSTREIRRSVRPPRRCAPAGAR